MPFNKHPYPANFAFASDLRPGKTRIGAANVAFAVERLRGDIWRLSASGPAGWARNESRARPAARRTRSGKTALRIDAGGGWTLLGADGAALLSAPPGCAFGKCGEASLFAFAVPDGARFYGLGEKMSGLERGGLRTKFWNTNVAADFDWRVWTDGTPDPMYASVPYLLVKCRSGWVGLLLDNPFETFACTAPERRGPAAGHGSGEGSEDSLQAVGASSVFWMGAREGKPVLYVIPGASAREVTRKLQALVGRVPAPPLWALGYHQSRWGYDDDRDLDMANAELRRYGFPCDALWLDIDCMDGYRVFSWDRRRFPDIARTAASLAEKHGRRLVPILDPGVKDDDAYGPKREGDAARVWCLTPEGTPFVGRVWPGDTLFPDFSLPEARAWWRSRVAKWVRESGAGGAWLDMNDPSTAHVDPSAMLFGRGRKPHAAFHNQYATAMAEATREGFLEARPGERPFLVSRSAFTGHNRFGAVWTGDNHSSERHLRAMIPCCVNLSLSGIPFCAPDMGGFLGDCTPRLLVEWYKAGFLFPFFRNHSCRGKARQEPWNCDAEQRDVLLEYTRLRYRMVPYLYQLFARQEETGDPILRPLFYEFDSTPAARLETLDGEFMVGPAVLQCPKLSLSRTDAPLVTLPPGAWHSAIDGAWVEGDRVFVQETGPATTPIYFREGQIVPMRPGEIGADHRCDLRRVEFHVFLRRGGAAREARVEYVFDDGLSFDYRRGKRSRLAVAAAAGPDGSLALSTTLLADGYGPPRAVSFVLYDAFERVTLDGRPATARPSRFRFAGVEQNVWRVATAPPP